MGRDQSSISREINENKTRGKYDPIKANHKAYVRTHNARFQFRTIHANKKIEKEVILGLKTGFSPEAISGRMKREKKKTISKNAIYSWLYSQYGQRYCKYLSYKQYGRKKRKGKKKERVLILGRINISKRKKLTRYDYEGDAVVSKRSRVALIVIHNPVTMYGDIKKVSNMKPHTAFLAYREMLSKVKAHSITFDNGQENRLHLNLKIRTYFCDPHAPWQKPGVENMNRFIRKYIPKKSDIKKYSDEYVASIVKIYNNLPKKKLKWKTPNEVMNEKHLFKKKKHLSGV